MFKQELNQKAKEILDKYGYEIDIEVMKGYDRRDFDPDHVKYNLSKEGKSVFKSEFRTEFEGDTYDSFGDSILRRCLNLREEEKYQKQKREFNNKARELLELKKNSKIFHLREKRELKQECERLMMFRSNFAPLASDGITANIAFIESNVKELEELLENLSQARKELVEKTAQPEEQERE